MEQAEQLRRLLHDVDEFVIKWERLRAAGDWDGIKAGLGELRDLHTKLADSLRELYHTKPQGTIALAWQLTKLRGLLGAIIFEKQELLPEVLPAIEEVYREFTVPFSFADVVAAMYYITAFSLSAFKVWHEQVGPDFALATIAALWNAWALLLREQQKNTPELFKERVIKVDFSR